LCGREYQASIRESVKALLEQQIDRMGYRDCFRISERSITSANGSEFIFSGLRHNIDSIKSMEGLTIVWIEEAHVISRHSLDTLVPTVRSPGAFFLYTLNPRFPTDPVYEDFIAPRRARSRPRQTRATRIR
jgi:phage terminase large subunit